MSAAVNNYAKFETVLHEKKVGYTIEVVTFNEQKFEEEMTKESDNVDIDCSSNYSQSSGNSVASSQVSKYDRVRDAQIAMAQKGAQKSVKPL